MQGTVSGSVNGEDCEALCPQEALADSLVWESLLNRKDIHDACCVVGETEARKVKSLSLGEPGIECPWWPGPCKGLTCLFCFSLLTI